MQTGRQCSGIFLSMKSETYFFQVRKNNCSTLINQLSRNVLFSLYIVVGHIHGNRGAEGTLQFVNTSNVELCSGGNSVFYKCRMLIIHLNDQYQFWKYLKSSCALRKITVKANHLLCLEEKYYFAIINTEFTTYRWRSIQIFDFIFPLKYLRKYFLSLVNSTVIFVVDKQKEIKELWIEGRLNNINSL